MVGAMTKPVFIHAGAHRTGSSSFQMCLARNRAGLEANGYDLAYPGRDGVPGGALRLKLPGPRHGAKRVADFAASLRAHLAELSPDPDRTLILSEENIPGRMIHFYDGQFFPASARRLESLAAALEAPPAHLLYVLRPYDQLFVSAYRKRAEDNPVTPFAQLVPHFLAMDRGWPELVAEFRDILNPRRLTVLDYAARGDSRSLLARLVPDLSETTLDEPLEAVNVSATDAALIELQSRYGAGESLSREDWKAVLARHAGDRSARGVAAFSETEQQVLRARYAHDLERVAALDGVVFG